MFNFKYKTVFIDKIANGRKRATEIERVCNLELENGNELVTSQSTPNLGTILIFKVKKEENK